MVRTLFCALLLALAIPTMAMGAVEWTRFVHPDTGAAVDIPPGFTVDRAHETPGTGRLFRSDDGRSLLRIWGNALDGSAFAEMVGTKIAADQADGWAVTYRSETPDWAAWSATRGGMVLHARIILVCAASQAATMRFTYPALDIAEYEPIVDRVSRSLAQDGGCY